MLIFQGVVGTFINIVLDKRKAVPNPSDFATTSRTGFWNYTGEIWHTKLWWFCKNYILFIMDMFQVSFPVSS